MLVLAVVLTLLVLFAGRLLWAVLVGRILERSQPITATVSMSSRALTEFAGNAHIDGVDDDPGVRPSRARTASLLTPELADGFGET